MHLFNKKNLKERKGIMLQLLIWNLWLLIRGLSQERPQTVWRDRNTYIIYIISFRVRMLTTSLHLTLFMI